MWPFSMVKEKTFEETQAEHIQDLKLEGLKKLVDDHRTRIRALETLLRKSGIYISCETCKFDGNCPIVTEDAKQFFPHNIAWCTADNWQPKEKV